MFRWSFSEERHVKQSVSKQDCDCAAVILKLGWHITFILTGFIALFCSVFYGVVPTPSQDEFDSSKALIFAENKLLPSVAFAGLK